MYNVLSLANVSVFEIFLFLEMFIFINQQFLKHNNPKLYFKKTKMYFDGNIELLKFM